MEPPPPPPIFDEHIEPGVRLLKRRERLDEYLAEVERLDKIITQELGQRIITRERWTNHYEFKAEKESLEVKIADLQKSYDSALTEQAGLAIATSSEDDVRPRLEKILNKEGPIPAPIMQECYAMILHQHKSLDYIRHMSPETEKLLFNWELGPLKEQLRKLREENYALRQGNQGNVQTTREDPAIEQVKSLQKQLENERKANQELYEQLRGPELATQRIAETQLDLGQDSTTALEESLANHKIQVAKLKADLITKDTSIQLQNKKIEAFQRNARLFEAKAQEGAQALERFTGAEKRIKELSDELRIKEYDLNGSRQLADFLKDQWAKLDSQYNELNRKADARLATLADEHNGLIQEKDLDIQQKNTLIQQRDTEINKMKTEIQQKNTQIKQKDTEIQQKNTQIKQKDIEIQQKATDISKKDVDIAELKNRLWGPQGLKTQLQTTEKHLNEQTSFSNDVSEENRILKAFKKTLKNFLTEALPLANKDDKVISSFMQLWHTWTDESWQAETAMGTQWCAPWLIKPPVGPSSAVINLENSSTISIAAKLFVLVHTRKHEEPLALSILPELTRRMPSCNENWVARIIVACAAKFNDDRSRVIKTMETASVSLSLLQLYIETKRRFPSLLEVPGMSETDRHIVSGLKSYTSQCDEILGTVSDTLYFAENVDAGVSALQESLGGRMIQYPLHGLSLISDTATEWVIVISAKERSITLTSKLLFQFDDENTSLTQWAYSVGEPSELSKITLINPIEALECQWWQKYILHFLPFDDNINALLESMNLT